MKLKLSLKPDIRQIVDFLVQLLIFLYIGSYFSPEHLFSKTITTGGDTASHYYTAQYLRDYLLPHGKILGWMQGNFAGFPVFQFYFPLPFVLMVLLSGITGLEIAFKIISALGVFLTPLCAYLGFRWLGFRFPTPAFASLFTLPFLFMEANSMWGGNIPSTLAGEFTNSMGLALLLLYMGSCYRGIQENRWMLFNGILLAMVGFSHGYTLLFAGAFSTYFVLAMPNSGRNFWYLVKVNALAFCLMGFWILPLLGYSPFTTRYNFIWVINSWKEILPAVLWPCLGLAILFTLYKLARMPIRGWREPFDHRVGLLWYILGLSYLFYLIAFRIHVVDIRFLPFLQIYICLLASVPIGLMASRLKANWIAAIIMAIGTLLWTENNVTFIRQWIIWNYSGFEAKSLWPAFSGVNNALKGTEADPRVVYEHSPDHNAAGTVRAFESLPLFSGRNTLEGLYMQSSISSPFVFYIQSEISEVTSCPLPDYHCSTLNLQRGADHLRLFNVRDFIVRSNAAKGAIKNSPDFEFRQSIPPYDLYRVKGSEDRYVVPLRYEPALLKTEDWKMDFYNWFKRPGTSEAQLVHLFAEDPQQNQRFPLQFDSLPEQIPQKAYAVKPKVSEEIQQEEIRIHTDTPGHPLLIKISYHPRWQVEGADRIYLASPSFMLVYPEGNEVRLTFGDPPLVRMGHVLTALSLLWILLSAPPVSRRFRAFEPAWKRSFLYKAQTRIAIPIDWLFGWYDRRRGWLAPLTIIVLATAALLYAFSIQQTDSSVLYNQGLELFSKQQYEPAIELFRKAMGQNPNSPSAINANYYYGICYFKRSDWQTAMNIFQTMVTQYPDSIYIPEALYHVGLCLQNLGQRDKATAQFESIISTYPASPWAGYAKTQLGTSPPAAARPATPPPAGTAQDRLEYNAAIALYDQGQLAEAGEAFKKLVAAFPASDLADDAQIHYCFTLYRREMHWQTIQELKIMLDKFGSSSWIPEAHYHMGLCLNRLGRTPEGVAEFNWIIQNAPDSRWAGFAKERLTELKK